VTSTPPASDLPNGPIKVKGPSIEWRNQKAEQLYERHRHHRGLASILSATIIGLSGGLFYTLMSPSPDPIVLMFDRAARGLLGVSIIAAVLLQFFHVLGYLHFAKATGRQLKASIKPEESETIYKALQAELDKGSDAFDWMDLTVKIAVFSHLAGLVAVGIGHIW